MAKQMRADEGSLKRPGRTWSTQLVLMIHVLHGPHIPNPLEEL